MGWHDQPDTATLIHDCATADSDAGVRMAAAQALVGGWAGEADTALLLAHCATAESDPNRRS